MIESGIKFDKKPIKNVKVYAIHRVVKNNE